MCTFWACWYNGFPLNVSKIENGRHDHILSCEGSLPYPTSKIWYPIIEIWKIYAQLSIVPFQIPHNWVCLNEPTLYDILTSDLTYHDLASGPIHQ